MRLLQRFRPKSPEASVPDGQVVYAVGDVHGRLDLVQKLTAQIGADAARLPGDPDVIVVFLGDYIDRGPDSAGVVEHVLDLAWSGVFDVRALKGNHEDALLSFLEDARVGPGWARYGGLETIRSYGAKPPATTEDAAGWEQTRSELAALIPERHGVFFNTLPCSTVIGDYCFVHAGLRPGVALADQAEFDLLTIRADFLAHKRPFEKKVVYGHTPDLEPNIEPHRIGIDTGAFATGVLTALKLSGTRADILQARL